VRCAGRHSTRHAFPHRAGTDVLEGDPLGRLCVDEAGVLARDDAVWDFALTRARCPIVMTLSGGYAARSAAVVADSLAALLRKYRLAE
jgi:acetoin utilization deacetylase AcuC-like enzyme